MSRLCLVFFSALFIPLAARAQSTLQPFNLTGTIELGSDAGLRELSSGYAYAEIDNVPGNNGGAALGFNFGGEMATYSAVLPRGVDGGTLYQYTFEEFQSSGTPPIISYQNDTRYFGQSFGTFTAPATGDYTFDFERTDLCSVVVNISSAINPDPITAIDVTVTANTLQPDGGYAYTLAGVNEYNPDDTGTTDPSLADGYLSSIDGGVQTVTGEFLLQPGLSYYVNTTATYADSSVASVYSVPFTVDSCPAVFNLTTVEPDSYIQASFWLQQDPGDVDAGTGPSVEAYEVAFTGTAGQTPFQYLPQQGDSPATLHIKATPGRYYAGSGPSSQSAPIIVIRWPDGKSGTLYPPAGAGSGAWSPIVPIDGGTQPEIGIWPDGEFFLLDDQTQSFSFQAPMAFVDGQLTVTGCASAQDITGGLFGLGGLAFGDGQVYTAQDGNQYQATTGTQGGIFNGGVGAGGSYELVGIPGPWSEYYLGLQLQHDSNNPDATDFFDAQTNFVLIDQPSLNLVAGRAGAVQESHSVEVGQVHVAMRVLNDDGTLRPFSAPSAMIASGETLSIDDGGTAANFSGSAQGSPTSKLVHVLTILSPAGTVNVSPSATVPSLPDGGGTVSVTSFPVLQGLVVPPPTSGACFGVCIDALDGGTATDDGVPPTISIQLPATVTASSLSVAGTITDAKPIETLTVNGSQIPFTTTATGASFTLNAPLVNGSNAFDIVAIDLCGEQGESMQTVTASLQPTLDAIPAQSVAVGALLTIALVGHVASGDTGVYSVDNLPAGAALNAATGVFTWSPTADEVAGSPYTLTFTVTDGALSASQMVAITVTPVDTPISFTATPAQTVTAGTLLSFTVHASDSANDPITYSDTGAPAASTLDATTGVFTWTPGTADISATPVSVTFIATHGADTASLVVPITVTAPPDLGITIQPIPAISVMVDVAISFTVTATDASGFSFTCSASGLPDGATFSGQTFNWTPTLTGAYSVTVTCTDTQGKSATATASITVGAKLKSDGCGCNENTPQPAAINLLGLVVYAWQRRRRARVG